ncbi:hypothetical protein CLORY_17850 [Clostridium oryzae]|uniref:ABC-transporter type IV n=1 Tax=Clostridium oryzae TaxID=1450648 RepID=A0A1V4IR58_9CLOT|nr:hypothetical protein CLORY_17850 [Clostridium oryzae]
MPYISNTTYYYLFLYFIIYSFAGWVLEVIYCYSVNRRLVNRGFLYGPVCPIYGVAAVIVIIVLSPFSNNYILLFGGGLILSSLLEFITGFVLEHFFKARWWDYTDNKFNIMGYVCLKFSIFWAIITVIFIKFIYPPVDRFVHLLPHSFLEISYNVLLIVFVVDITATINNLIQFRKIFNELYELSSELKCNIETMKNKLVDTAKASILEGKIKYLKESYDKLMSRSNFKFRRIILAFPKVSSKSFGKIIDEIKERIL